ncbi:heavy-metal-associated domain-containing protein [Brytella acorum]|uniref:Heavy-metal-associated domain-containing protein n=1 Tax=Brytella acorum TaxID=2959299 RepID=A0AA35V7I6_9PROT|nr:heavy-metal-associated domain-containing protein [Brytella acorum]MDF3625265.1 heavy-metal-associated domain-containing protein [Brytella acorum]CAI9119323.1 heavy-metal-associated domain-containing protein [Brytella acorum]
MTETAYLKVEGMHCDGCSSKLRKALEAEPGVREADVLLEGGKVTVYFDPAVADPRKFVGVVEELGFDVVP